MKRTILFTTLLLALATLVAYPVTAQQNRTLFQTDTSVQFRPAPSEFSRTAITVDPSLHEQPPQAGDRLDMPVGNRTITFRVQRVTEFMPGVWSVTAVDEFQQDRFAAFSYTSYKITGVMQLLPENELYYFSSEEALQTDVLARMRPDMTDILACSGEAELPVYQLEEDHPLSKARSLMAAPITAPTAPPVFAAMALPDTPVMLDVMLAYTPAARDWANNSPINNPGSIELALAQAMNLSQQALDNSNVGIELRLVHTHLLNYTDDTNPAITSNTHLRRITASPTFNPYGAEFAGFMEEVHTLRNQFGADVVAMMVQVDDTGGLAWRIGSYGGVPNLGFSLNRIQQTHRTYTLIHEIGHNMGKSHGRVQEQAAADVFGGVHAYSVGWMFDPVTPNPLANPLRPRRATVMQYGDSQSIDYPGFSSPEIIAEGSPTGNVSGGPGPADNARSLRDMKGVIASYRTATHQPPVASIPTNEISITLAQGQRQIVTVPIANTGQSALQWSAEVGVGEANTAALSGTQTLNLPVERVLYENNFELGEGFPLGSHVAAGGFRTFNSQKPFNIESVRPASGSQHMRLQPLTNVPTGNSEFNQVSPPLLGRSGPGAYSLEFDLAANYEGTNSRYDVYLRDASNGQFTAGIVITNAGITYVRTVNESTGAETFSGNSGWVVPRNAYVRHRFTVNAETGRLSYFRDGVQYFERAMLNGRSMDYIDFYRVNTGSATDFVDIDNIRLLQHFSGYSWLTVQTPAGQSATGASQNLEIEFDARTAATGTYTGRVNVRTNDPARTSTSIPVRLVVTQGTSVDDNEMPNVVNLTQNYPNPFNPNTNITYQLPDDAQVQLDVFDITGRHVANLVDGRIAAGVHTASFDASQLSSGVYLYTLRTGTQTITRKMVLIK
jgi:hypothetical protein